MSRIRRRVPAQKINEPMLMIHGEADDNTGTFPILSERMCQAMKRNDRAARDVAARSACLRRA
jgi:dipeptidyl aminopeptidase/acylaminoacyl peptidase